MSSCCSNCVVLLTPASALSVFRYFVWYISVFRPSAPLPTPPLVPPPCHPLARGLCHLSPLALLFSSSGFPPTRRPRRRIAGDSQKRRAGDSHDRPPGRNLENLEATKYRLKGKKTSQLRAVASPALKNCVERRATTTTTHYDEGRKEELESRAVPHGCPSCSHFDPPGMRDKLLSRRR